MDQALVYEAVPSVGLPGYLLDLEKRAHEVRVEVDGQVIAESDRTIVLHEARLAPVYYFPRDDVRMDLLERGERETLCPFKGTATHWNIRVGTHLIDNAAWSYEAPLEDVRELEGYIAFYWNRMDRWFEDGGEILVPGPTVKPAAVNPLKDWLVNEAWDTKSTPELFRKLTDCFVNNGIPVDRFRMILRTLHPLLAARAYSWASDAPEIDEYLAPYSMLETSEYLENPFAAIFEGASGLRRRLEGADPQLDYPILQELRTEGFTDYVAMPMIFSDGQINVLSLATKRVGGFSTDELGAIYEIMPVVSRLFEAHYLRRMAITLLDTYLGEQTGRRVLEGRIKRGDGDNIYAVIWLCDLRHSTELADTMSRHDYLELLNEFLEVMAGSVLDAGGEVLRYIGDAALAIFPITDDIGLGVPEATKKAADAARDAVERMATLNAARREADQEEIEFGIGLHLGNVMYGNIGAPERLEFTVVGSAANEAARLEELTKQTGNPIAISERFKQCYPGELVQLGEFRLPGLEEMRKIFTLPREG